LRVAPKLERSDPPYRQIARRIRDDIESGVLAEGATVPSAREITTTWGVALATATNVHARLRSEGLIEAVPGVGTIVAARHTAADKLQRLASTHSRGLIYGVNERAIIRSSELVNAPKKVADALGLPEGAQVAANTRKGVRTR
jgi:DNA-binding GntR family transcriptional regulator